MARRSLLSASPIARPLAATAAGFDAGDESWTAPAAPLAINGQWHTGPGAVPGIDNIQGTAVPAPASAALLLACLRRKR